MYRYLSIVLYMLVLPVFTNVALAQEKKQVYSGNRLRAEYTYKDGKLSGPYRQWYPDGKIQSEGEYTATHKTGKAFFYYRSDTLREVRKFTMSIGYDLYDYEYETTLYFDNGKPSERFRYKNGKGIPGKTEWYKNGNLKSEFIYDEATDAYVSKEYFESGQVKNVRKWKTDWKNNGEYKEWTEKGALIKEISHSNSRQEEEQKEWDPNGQMIIYSRTEKGKKAEEKRWDNTGKVILDSKSSDEKNAVEYVSFFSEDKSAIQSINVRNKYSLEDSVIAVRIARSYSKPGTLKYLGMSYWKDNLYFNDVTNNWIYNGQMHIKYADTLTMISFRNNYIDFGYDIYNKTFRVGSNFSPVNHYIGNSAFFASYPANAGEKEKKKAIEDCIEKIKEQFTDPKKCMPEFLMTRQDVDSVRRYMQYMVNKFQFDKVEMIPELDASRTGRITYLLKGSDMRYTVSLKEGLLHGTCTFWLNEKDKLDEKTFAWGLLHGPFKEWYATGKLAREGAYSFNKPSGVIRTYYLDGSDKIKEVYDRKGVKRETTEWYRNGKMKMKEKHLDFTNDFWFVYKDEWYENGKPMTLSDYKDSVFQHISFNTNDTITSYSVTDFNIKGKGGLSRRLYQGKYGSSVNLDRNKLKTYSYSFNKAGVVIKGKADWNSSTNSWEVNDNLGKAVIVDRSIPVFDKRIPCNCREWEKADFFAQSLDDFVSTKTFNEWKFDFLYAKDLQRYIFGNPYYYSTPPQSYEKGKRYDANAEAFIIGDLKLGIPDSNGIFLNLNVCRSKYAFAKISYSVKFIYGDKKSLHVTLFPKTTGVEFPSSILRQWDDAAKAPSLSEAEKPMGTIALFNQKDIRFDHTYHVYYDQPVLSCFPRSEITGTGMLLDIYNAIPDMSAALNHGEMRRAYSKDSSYYHSRMEKLMIPAESIAKFTGIYATSSSLLIPLSSGQDVIPVKFTGKELCLSSAFIMGTLTCKAKRTGENGYVLSAEKQVQITGEELKKQLNAKGINEHAVEYDAATGEIVVHFIYKTNAKK